MPMRLNPLSARTWVEGESLMFDFLYNSTYAVTISLLATIPPSILAARLDPVEGLRYD